MSPRPMGLTFAVHAPVCLTNIMTHIEYFDDAPPDNLRRHHTNAAQLRPIMAWNKQRVAQGLRRRLSHLQAEQPDSPELGELSYRLSVIDGDELP